MVCYLQFISINRNSVISAFKEACVEIVVLTQLYNISPEHLVPLLHLFT
jgi:hypothetical protein